MEQLCYISDGEMYYVCGGKTSRLRSNAIETYRKNAKQLAKKYEWRTTGEGAKFMGMNIFPADQQVDPARVTCLTGTEDGGLIYAAHMAETGGLYGCRPGQPDDAEILHWREADLYINHLAYSPQTQTAAFTINEYPEKHIALWQPGEVGYSVLTEGDSVEVYPSFSQATPEELLFASAGFAKGEKGLVFGPYSIQRLAPQKEELTTVCADEKFDFLLPTETADGTLYCIRRPRNTPKGGFSLLDVLLAPIRLLRALFGWLNFFTQRYSGESLTKSTGSNNPAKPKQNNPEQIFIEGNLIQVEKTQRQNKAAGAAYPGNIPKSWELVAITPGAKPQVIKRGVLSYALGKNGELYYSNGNHVLQANLQTGTEEQICEAKLATNLCLLGSAE